MFVWVTWKILDTCFQYLKKDCKYIITHSKYVRTILGKKTDNRDSFQIVDIFKHGLVEPSFISPEDIR